MVFKADNFIAEAKSCGLKQCYVDARTGVLKRIKI